MEEKSSIGAILNLNCIICEKRKNFKIDYLSLLEYKLLKIRALPSSKILMSSNEVSIEDRKFLHILEKGTVKKDVHYVAPLPFWDENLVMPNNRIQALRRLKCLKRFLTDKRFPQDYPKITNLVVGAMIKLHMLVRA